MDKDLALLHQKLDYLTEQLELQNKQKEGMNELMQDAIPVVNHMIKLSIEELAEIGSDFQLEDLLFLLKRILRDTQMLVGLLDQVEAVADLAEEGQVMGKRIFHQVTMELDRLEREGYFGFARAGWGVMEQIMTEFSEEDVRALGDNIVTILTTVRNMTQPEVMALANNAVGALQDETLEVKPVSAFGLLRELSKPETRIGMARLLNLVKALANSPQNQTPSN